MAERRTGGRGAACLLVAAFALFAGCAPLAPRVEFPAAAPSASPAAPPGFPNDDYRVAASRGDAVYRIDPARSRVIIEVRRAGALARFGHDHVVSGHDVQGYVAPEGRRADLYLPLDRLVVDDPAMRADAGFDTRPSEADIAGTRANMLERVLEARRFPWLLVQVRAAALDASTMAVSITLHGTTRALQVPVQLSREGAEIAASGRFEVRQSDFGITPFSILGGAIQVEDRLALRFALRARRL
jgi:polyisoprenoid-binding protein YceI